MMKSRTIFTLFIASLLTLQFPSKAETISNKAKEINNPKISTALINKEQALEKLLKKVKKANNYEKHEKNDAYIESIKTTWYQSKLRTQSAIKPPLTYPYDAYTVIYSNKHGEQLVYYCDLGIYEASLKGHKSYSIEGKNIKHLKDISTKQTLETDELYQQMLKALYKPSKKFHLEYLGKSKRYDKEVLGIRVTQKKAEHKHLKFFTIEFYFDTKTFLHDITRTQIAPKLFKENLFRDYQTVQEMPYSRYTEMYQKGERQESNTILKLDLLKAKSFDFPKLTSYKAFIHSPLTKELNKRCEALKTKYKFKTK